MALNGSAGYITWAANGLLAVALGVVAWTGQREINRNDDQDRRIQALERCVVQLDYIAEDVREIKTDVKKLMGR